MSFQLPSYDLKLTLFSQWCDIFCISCLYVLPKKENVAESITRRNKVEKMYLSDMKVY